MATIERLRKRPDFLAAAAGRRLHTERMSLQGRPRDGGDAGGLRLGFTVTKRVGHATERNRIKRRLRAAADRVAADLPPDLAARAVDLVVIARRPLLAATFAAIVDDLHRGIPQVTRPGTPARSGRRDGPAAAQPVHPRRGRGGTHVPPAATAIPDARDGVPDGQ